MNKSSIFIFILTISFLFPFSVESKLQEDEFFESILSPVQITSNIGEDYSSVVSNGGKNLAFVSDRNGNSDIWILPLKSSVRKAPFSLTRHSADDSSPAWSPTGDQIVFVSMRNDSKGDIYIAVLSNEQEESKQFKRLTESDSFDNSPVWSPDGKYIAYASRRAGEKNDNIWWVDLETGKKTQLTTTGGSTPAFSVNGKYLAFTTGDESVWGNISVLRLSDNKIISLTEGRDMDGFPTWSKDGSKIYYTRFSDDTNLDGIVTIDDRPNIWSIEFDDKRFHHNKLRLHQRQLTSSSTYDLYPHISSDNLLYYTSIRKGNIDIWRISPSGLLNKQMSLDRSIELAGKICSDSSFSPYECQLAYRNTIQDYFESADKKRLAEVQYKIARSYQSLKNYSQAEREYRFLQKNFSEVSLYHGLSKIELETIAIEKAKIKHTLTAASSLSIENLNSIIKEYQDISSVVAYAYLEIGNIYIGAKDNLQALQSYQKVLARFPNEREIAANASFNKSKLYLDFKNRDKLINAFLDVLKEYPEQVFWGKKAADEIISLFDNEDEPLKKRINSLRQLIEQYQDIPILPARAQNKIGHFFYNDNENLIAKKEYRQVIERFSKEEDEKAAALFALAKIYFEEGEYEKSLKIYRDLERNSFDKIDVFRKARKQFIRGSLDKGKRELNEGEIGLSIKTYRKLLNYDRSIVEAHRGLIRSYASLKKVNKIVDEYKKGVSDSRVNDSRVDDYPENATEIYSLGLALTYLKELPIDAAIKLVRKSIALNSQVSYFHQTLGWLYEQKDSENNSGVYLEQALEAYQTALALNDESEFPDNEANLLLNYGNASFNLQNFNIAYKFYKMRLETKVLFESVSRESLFYQRFGQAAFKQGEYSEAVSYFQKAIEESVKQDDLNRQAELNDRLALSYQELGKYDEAVKYFSRVLVLNKKLGNVKSISITLRNIANNLYTLGETETWPEKTEKLSRALSFYFESMESLEEFGVKDPKKQKKRGLISFEFEKAVGTDASQAGRGFDKVGEEKLILNYLGKIYADLRDYEKAISYFEKKLNLTPPDLPLKGNIPVLTERAVILNQVGVLYYKMGDIVKSLYHFEKSLELCMKLENSHGIAVNSTNIGKVYVEQYLSGSGAISAKSVRSHISLLAGALSELKKKEIINEPLYIVLLKNSLAILHFSLATGEDKSFLTPSFPNNEKGKKDLEDNIFKNAVLNELDVITEEIVHIKKSLNMLKSSLFFLNEHKVSIRGDDYFRARVVLSRNLEIVSSYVLDEDKERKKVTAQEGVEYLPLIPSLASRGNGVVKKNKGFSDDIEPLQKKISVANVYKLVKEQNLFDLQWKIKLLDSFSAERETEIKRLKEAVEILENIPFGFYPEEDNNSIILKQRLYDRLVFLLMQDDKADESLQYLERAKGMELISQLAGKNIDFENPDRNKYFKDIRTAALDLKNLYSKFVTVSLKSGEVYSVKKKFEIKQLAYKELLDNITEEDPEFASIFKPVELYIEEIQEILNDDEIVRIYKMYNKNLLQWTITKNNLTGDIQLIDKELFQIISKLNTDDVISDAENKKLSELLFSNKTTHYRRIYIIAEKGLEDIRWPLLEVKDKKLMDTGQIVHLVSLNHLLNTYNKRNLSRAALLSVNTDQNLFKIFKRNFRSALNFHEEENIRSSFLNELHYYGILHLNGGIVLTPSSPAHSFIKPSLKSIGLSRLESWELFGLQRAGNLVSLSDLQERKESGDISSLKFLVQSFSYAGFPYVLIEQKKNDEETRQKLFKKFYKHLTEKSPAESLRLAQIEIYRESPNLNSWADFRLYGYGGMTGRERIVFAESNLKDNIKTGIRLFSEKKWKDAITAFEKALILTDILPQKQYFQERIYKALTDAAYNINDFERAIKYEKRLISLLEDSDDPEKLAEEVYFLGILYSKVENYSASVKHLSRALNIYKEYEILDKLAEGYSTLGVIKEQSSDFTDALNAFASSLKLQQELGEAVEEGRELRRIGRIFYKRLNKYKTAEEYFQKALKIFVAEGQKQQEIQTLLEIGLARERVGDFDRSLKYYDMAYLLAKDINDMDGLTLAPLYKANSYWFQADYQNAFENIRMALKMAEKNRSKQHQVFAFNTLGLIYWTLNDLIKAKEYLGKGLDIALKINSKLDVASAYNNLGLIYRQEKNYEESIEYFKRALDIDEEIKTKWGRGYDHRNMGMSYLRLRDFQKARFNIELAVNLSGEIGNRINETKSMLEMGNIHLEKGDFSRAAYYFKNTFKLSENINLPEVKWRALRGEGKSSWMAGDKENALKKYRLAIEIVEELRASIKLEEFKNGFIENKQDLYKEIIILLLEMGQKEEAFNYSERARARSFIDLLGKHKLNLKNDSDQELFERVQNLKQQIFEAEEALLEADNKDFIKTKEKLANLKNQLQDSATELKEKNSELSSFVTVDPLKLADLHALLDEDVALIEYFVTENEVIAWVVHGNKLDLARTAIEEKKLTDLIKKYRISMEGLMPMDRISRDLYDILIKPVEPFLERVRYVGIIPHGSLHYLSFASLKNDSGYFIEQQPIFYSPSASALKYTFERRTKEKNVKVLAIGNPDLGSFNYDLPLSEMEANSIKWSFADVDILLRKEAKESWLIKNIENYGIIHIASHGEFNDINPLFSALKLVRDVTEDGNLKVSEIFSLNIKADLVTLSACQTGLGEITSGDEIIGLNRAFFYAGTHSIISSLWRISDISTAVLIKHFYRNYKKHNKAEALRKAQLFIKKHYSHPSYWSGLTLTGDYR